MERASCFVSEALYSSSCGDVVSYDRAAKAAADAAEAATKKAQLVRKEQAQINEVADMAKAETEEAATKKALRSLNLSYDDLDDSDGVVGPRVTGVVAPMMAELFGRATGN